MSKDSSSLPGNKGVLLAHRPEETLPAHVHAKIQHTHIIHVLPMKNATLEVL